MRRQQEEVCWDCNGPDALCDKHAAEKRVAEYGRRASVEWASEIRPRKQVWLWDNKIPIGTPSACAGKGGTGKTSYVLHLIALLSLGQLPGQHHGNPRRSIIWSGEDAWDKVLVPRLIAAGADLSMVGRLKLDTLVDNDTLEVTPRLPLDTATIAEAVTDSEAVLVFIDPIASTMTGDLNREADVRSAVDALARVAEDTGAVMMFVRHFNKGGGNASDKMSGNHAFRDAVRSVFLFAEDEDGDRVVVTQDKGNYAPRGEESFAFRLESTTVDTDDGPTDVARVVELGTSEVSVGDVINRVHQDDEDAGERIAAEHWLQDYLEHLGPTPSKVIKGEAAKEKISERTLQRAKKKAGVLDESIGFPRRSTWYLPSQTALLAEQKRAGATVGVTQEPGATGATEGELQEHDGATESDLQSRQGPARGGTERLAGPSPATMPTSGHHPALITTRRARTRGKFRPPTGPGRCLDCGHHVGTMGHADTCSSKQAAS